VLNLAINGDGQLIVSGSIGHSAKTWSVAREPEVIAMEVSLRRSAVARVRSLYEQHMLKSRVLEDQGWDTTLCRRMQRAAITIAEWRTENASGLYEAGLLSVVRPGGRPDDYRLAVERLEAAYRVVDDDLERMAQYRHALALACYRTGQAKKALETLDFNARGVQPDPSPVARVATALAQKQLGRTNKATAAIALLRKLVATKWVRDQETSAFLREAEEMIKKLAKRAPDAPGL
jgi:tetratricopeptide (TPR) repeat protein